MIIRKNIFYILYCAIVFACSADGRYDTRYSDRSNDFDGGVSAQEGGNNLDSDIVDVKNELDNIVDVNEIGVNEDDSGKKILSESVKECMGKEYDLYVESSNRICPGDSSKSVTCLAMVHKESSDLCISSDGRYEPMIENYEDKNYCCTGGVYFCGVEPIKPSCSCTDNDCECTSCNVCIEWYTWLHCMTSDFDNLEYYINDNCYRVDTKYGTVFC